MSIFHIFRKKFIFIFLGNTIGDDGAKFISQSLQFNTTLTSLHLGGILIENFIFCQSIYLIYF